MSKAQGKFDSSVHHPFNIHFLLEICHNTEVDSAMFFHIFLNTKKYANPIVDCCMSCTTSMYQYFYVLQCIRASYPRKTVIASVCKAMWH